MMILEQARLQQEPRRSSYPSLSITLALYRDGKYKATDSAVSEAINSSKLDARKKHLLFLNFL